MGQRRRISSATLTATTTVLMGAATGPVLLGATTLEELGLVIDPLNRRLVPVEIFLAAAG